MKKKNGKKKPLDLIPRVFNFISILNYASIEIPAVLIAAKPPATSTTL